MNYVTISSDYGLTPTGGRAITWTNAELLSINDHYHKNKLGWNFYENMKFSFYKMHSEMSAKMAAIVFRP